MKTRMTRIRADEKEQRHLSPPEGQIILLAVRESGDHAKTQSRDAPGQRSEGSLEG